MCQVSSPLLAAYLLTLGAKAICIVTVLRCHATTTYPTRYTCLIGNILAQLGAPESSLTLALSANEDQGARGTGMSMGIGIIFTWGIGIDKRLKWYTTPVGGFLCDSYRSYSQIYKGTLETGGDYLNISCTSYNRTHVVCNTLDMATAELDNSERRMYTVHGAGEMNFLSTI